MRTTKHAQYSFLSFTCAYLKNKPAKNQQNSKQLQTDNFWKIDKTIRLDIRKKKTNLPTTCPQMKSIILKQIFLEML